MRRKEDLETFKFYLSVLPKSKGTLISLTLTQVVYKQLQKLSLNEDNKLILPSTLKYFKLYKIHE